MGAARAAAGRQDAVGGEHERAAGRGAVGAGVERGAADDGDGA